MIINLKDNEQPRLSLENNSPSAQSIKHDNFAFL